MVHLRTVPDAWHAKVLAARLGSEGIVTQLRGAVSGPYPFGAVSVLVEAAQAELAAELLLADEVEAAFSGIRVSAPPFDRALAESSGTGGDEGTSPAGDWVPEGAEHPLLTTSADSDIDIWPDRPRTRPPWRRAVAAVAALLVAGAPVLAHFVG